MSQNKTTPVFTKACWLLLAYTLIVILWGAWVRISHSGDGCGASWPLCNGVFVPEEAPSKTWVEFAHRIQSGLFGILVVAMTLFARKLFPAGHLVRRFAMMTLFFTITEALLGAKLVIFGLVGQNDSMFRAFVMGLHFINSVLLVVSMTLTAAFSGRAQWKLHSTPLLSTRMNRRLPVLATIAFLLLGATGAIAALATTLFPSDSLLAGFQADISGEGHMLLRLRGLHPSLGVFAGTALVLLFYFAAELAPKTAKTFIRRSWTVIFIAATTVILGSITLLWLSPIPLKLVHLLLAHTLGIALTLWWQALRYEIDSPSPSQKA